MRISLVLALASIASPAFALEQKQHLAISQEACTRAGMPSELCRSVARAAYDVDSDEFEDMAAHGQTPEGTSVCDGANTAIARGRGLGARVFAGLLDGEPASLRNAAGALGQALHLVQDTCAHAGMPNPQHAWWSNSDTCQGTALSPDAQPEAHACAVLWSDVVMAAFARTVAAAGVPHDALDLVRTDGTRIPPLSQVCDYLESGARWDGIDRRWSNDAVLPPLVMILAEAIDGLDHAPFDVCADGASAIARAPDAQVDTSNDPTCSLTKSLCDVANPSRGPNEAKMYNADGCSMAPGARAPAGPWAALLLVAFFARARRRRASLRA